MVEDAPQDLVHDLLLRGRLRRPPARPAGDRLGGGDLVGQPRRRSPATTAPCTGRRNVVVAAAGNLDARPSCCGSLRAAAAARDGSRTRAQAARLAAAAVAALPAQGHRAVPRLPRGARHLALRPPPVRRLGARRDPGRLGVVAALPGDPREARHGVRRLHASRRSTPTPGCSASTSARARTTSPPASRSSPSRSADIAAGNLRPNELRRAKDNLEGRILLSMESTSSRMSRLGKSLITDTELLGFERIIEEIEAVDADAVAELAAVLLEPEPALGGRASAATRSASARPCGSSTPSSTRPPRPRSPCASCSSGTRGRSGAVLAPALARGRARGRGHARGALRLRTRRSTSRGRTPSSPTRARCLAAGVPCVIGTSGFDEAAVDAAARAAGLPCLYAPNFALGAVLMMRLAREAARVPAARRDRGAAQRGEGRRAVGDGEGDRGRARRRRADPLRAPARAGGAPGGAPRRRGPAAHHPPRRVLARGVRAGRPARARAAALAAGRG